VVAGVVAGFHNLAIVPIELTAIGSMLVLDRVVTPIISRWHRGALGEEHVGAIIDSLRSDGWLAIHDASTGRGNIDHILVGPGGLVRVETKSHRGRIDPMLYLILGLAPGDPVVAPATARVDYVRVWQR
jgi:hypothetical protein